MVKKVKGKHLGIADRFQLLESHLIVRMKKRVILFQAAYVDLSSQNDRKPAALLPDPSKEERPRQGFNLRRYLNRMKSFSSVDWGVLFASLWKEEIDSVIFVHSLDSEAGKVSGGSSIVSLTAKRRKPPSFFFLFYLPLSIRDFMAFPLFSFTADLQQSKLDSIHRLQLQD